VTTRLPSLLPITKMEGASRSVRVRHVASHSHSHFAAVRQFGSDWWRTGLVAGTDDLALMTRTGCAVRWGLQQNGREH
jgi:hypothetical protein